MISGLSLFRSAWLLELLSFFLLCASIVPAVVDALMPQGVAESPEFADDVNHELPL